MTGFELSQVAFSKKNSVDYASFTYDGDGNRVKTIVGGTTTVFIGSYYEWTSSTVKKYYGVYPERQRRAGTTRIAMRENSTLIFLSGDHLGSTSLVYKTDTGLVIKKLYKPWGETRYTSTTMPTRFQFTGQYREVSLGGADGLYYFVARWYDQALGRFLQADTIVPKAGDVQAWDRYAYVNNSPLKYSDPTGHYICWGEDCSLRMTTLPITPPPTCDNVLDPKRWTKKRDSLGGTSLR
jgi:RHS repeat-associated protein